MSTRVEYTYDCIGMLKTVTVDKRNGIDVNEVTTYTYNDVGSLKSVEYPNGNYAEYAYDELNRLTKLVNYQDDTKAVTLSSFDYTLTADGMRDSVTESDGTVILWDYDNLNRLIEEDYNAPGTTDDYLDKYIYDLVGNRFSKDNSIDIIYYFYNENDQLTKEANDADGSNIIVSYQYNDNGSLTQKVITDGNTYDYTYNLLNRLNSFSDGNITVSYKYDSDGTRVQKDDGTTVTDYLIDPFNHTGYSQVFKEKKAGSPDRTFIIGLDLIAQSKGPHRRYLLYDGHSSVRQLTSASGSITDTYDYDAYGNALGFAPSTATTNLLYTGEWYDGDLGFYYNRNRWYRPESGLFNRIDPFSGNTQDPISLHKYLYCHANPINKADPLGTFTTPDIVLANTIRNVLMDIDISINETVEVSARTTLTRGSATRALVMLAAFNTVPYLIGPAVNFASDVVDDLFSSLVRRLSRSKVKISGKALVGLADHLRDLYRRASRAGSKSGAAEFIGEVGASWTAKAKGFTRVKFQRHHIRHGIDQIWRKGNVYIIVEAKGGTGELFSGQMSKQWINRGIEKLGATDEMLAKKLLRARDSGRLKGMVVRTRTAGPSSFTPRFVLRDWAEIGEHTWSGR